MGPPPGQRSRDVLDDHMDAIDLTLSSPEPEPKTRPQANAHQRQQQPATGLKQETGSSSRTVDYGNRYTQEQDGSRSRNAPQPQPRQIHPQHVTQIIDSSNPRALRQVVLHLCKTSPALSGAIVRGLAPYSSYAQTLIRNQQAKSQTQTTRAVKTEPKSNAQDAYERMRKTLATSSSGQGSVVRSHGDRLSGVSENRDGLRVPKVRTTPRVKREYRASSTDSDESSHIVDFPELERETLRHDRPQTITSSDSRHSSTADVSVGRLAVRQRYAQLAAPDQKPKLCLRCGDLFKEGDTNCPFHPGHEVPTGNNDIAKYSCCQKFVLEPGCTFGRHTSEIVGGATLSTRSSPSLNAGSQSHKRPRFM